MVSGAQDRTFEGRHNMVSEAQYGTTQERQNTVANTLVNNHAELQATCAHGLKGNLAMPGSGCCWHPFFVFCARSHPLLAPLPRLLLLHAAFFAYQKLPDLRFAIP
eukprot:scaffold57726_cov17-Tisochrysis_lutea.AAC.1